MRRGGYTFKRIFAAAAAMALLLAGSMQAEQPDELLIEEEFTEAAAEPIELYVDDEDSDTDTDAQEDVSGTDGEQDDSEENADQDQEQEDISTAELISAEEEVVVIETEPQTEAATEPVTEEEASAGVELKGLHFASDYKEVFEALKNADSYKYVIYEDDIAEYAAEETAAAADVSAAAGAEASSQNSAASYSDTNVREAGVDEADVVKTDGTYLYMLYDDERLSIVKAAGSDSQLVSDTKVGDNAYSGYGYARDMYVDGDLLTVVFEKYAYWSGRDDEPEPYAPRGEYTQVYTYDISDRQNPVLTGNMWQDGYYSQSRKIGNYIYLYTGRYLNLYGSYEDSDIVPVVNDQPVDAKDVCIPDHVEDASYLIVSSFEQAQTGTVLDRKVLVSGTGMLYVSTDNLYAMVRDYTGSTTRTDIIKFACADGKISGVAACRVKGIVNDTFSVDEYQGNLRVLTTYTGSEGGALLEALAGILGFDYYDEDRWVNHNALFILDEGMNLRSRLTGIARDEQIRSARYFGDTAYFVTFLQTDPLFSADLSDPDAPKLIGELKVSGFSAYLHPFGDGLLLGLGYEADEETGITSGLKLSMFDISDPAAVTEIDRYVFRGITWCEALSNYKAIFARPEKGLAGFFCDDRYMLFSYDRENGFTKVLHYDYYEDMLGAEADCSGTRGVYIGDEMYLAGGSYVVGFDMANGFEKNLVMYLREE